METQEKTFAKATEQIQEVFKTAANIYKEGALSILDAYNKQLSISAEWYDTFVNSALKTDFKKNYETVSDLLKKNLDSFQLSKEVTEKIFRAWSNEESFAPVSKEVTDALFNIYHKQAELFSDSGRQFLNSIYKEENQKQY